MRGEIESLERNNTWDVVNENKNQKLLSAKWIFKIKSDKDGTPRYKARLVARGFAQTQGTDYDETYSPVVKYSTIRYLLALATRENLQITHMDVTTAYLNGELEEEIFLRPPEGLNSPEKERKVWKSKKAIYGLKQSGRAWNKKLDSTLRAIGLQKSAADPCVYLKEGNKRRLIVVVYVDDLLIISNDKTEQQRLKQYLENNFEMKDLGSAKKYLGMTIERDIPRGELYLHQASHIESMFQKFGMKNCNPVSTPMDPNVKLSSEMEPKTEVDQREME